MLNYYLDPSGTALAALLKFTLHLMIHDPRVFGNNLKQMKWFLVMVFITSFSSESLVEAITCTNGTHAYPATVSLLR